MENRIGEYEVNDLELMRWPFMTTMAICTKRGDILPHKDALSIIEQLSAFYRQVSGEQIAEHNEKIEKVDIEKFNATIELVQHIPLMQEGEVISMEKKRV